MANKIKNSEKIKARTIINVLDFMEHGKSEDRKKALENLSEFAKFYNIPLRRKAFIPDLKIHLREFILNEKGYMFAIPNLYNSLQN